MGRELNGDTSQKAPLLGRFLLRERRAPVAHKELNKELDKVGAARANATYMAIATQNVIAWPGRKNRNASTWAKKDDIMIVLRLDPAECARSHARKRTLAGEDRRGWWKPLNVQPRPRPSLP